MTQQEAAALYKAEKAKRPNQVPDLTIHDWATLGHRLFDYDTHKLRPDAFVRGAIST